MAAWNRLSTRQMVAVTLGVSAGAVILCVCYAKYRSGRAAAAPGSTEDDYELRIKIPQHVAERLTAGGSGNVISQFSMQSAARIEVIEIADGPRELSIKGSPAQVDQAQELLSGILQNDTMLRVELHLPARSVCHIVGQGGQRLRDISKASGAKIHCDSQSDCSLGLGRSVAITGSWKQVEDAKALIQKVMEGDTSILKRTADSTFRSHRKEIIAVKKKDGPPTGESGATPNADHSPDSFHTADSPEERSAEDGEPLNKADGICKFEVPSPDFNFRADEYVDVCASASEDPGHFWIQILGSRSSQLDKLTVEMSDFYVRQKRGGVSEIRVGDIVAAQFRDDASWYRAEVIGFLADDRVDLYYVDYGDNWATLKQNVFPLRSDFLSLPFQAVECGLANVSPIGGKWSAEALDAFDSLAHCAKWRPLLAKISSFPSPGVSHFQIHLYDPSRNPMLDIGEELIRRGHAIERRMSPVKADDETLVSRLLEEVTSLSMKPQPPSFTSRQEKEHPLESDESIEVLRADVDPRPNQQYPGTPSPSSQLESSAKTDSLEQSLSRVRLSNDNQSSSQSSVSPASAADSSSELSSSTCTASEGPSLLSSSSSMEDSSICSPRGCFYYLTDEVSSSSIFTSSEGEVITISSDSEEEAGTVQGGAKPASSTSDVFLNSSSDDVILVEDDA